MRTSFSARQISACTSWALQLNSWEIECLISSRSRSIADCKRWNWSWRYRTLCTLPSMLAATTFGNVVSIAWCNMKRWTSLFCRNWAEMVFLVQYIPATPRYTTTVCRNSGLPTRIGSPPPRNWPDNPGPRKWSRTSNRQADCRMN